MPAIRDLTRRFGHRRWFAAVARSLVPLDRLVGRLTRGRVVALGLVPSLLITTTGRRSGQPRSNPLLFVRDGDRYVVTGSNWGQPRQPAWALNLLADPAATVTVAGRRIPVRARVVTGAERERLWRLLVSQWPAYETYVRRAGGRDIRVFLLEPVGADADRAAAPSQPVEPA
jgi:deazaflavin-dependent oxidoreductase (nitroreductase family)